MLLTWSYHIKTFSPLTTKGINLLLLFPNPYHHDIYKGA